VGKELSLEEAARRLGVSPEELRRKVERGTFRPVGRDPKGRPLFTEESLKADLEAARRRREEDIEDLLGFLLLIGLFEEMDL